MQLIKITSIFFSFVNNQFLFYQWHHLLHCIFSSTPFCLQLALAYNEALLSGRLTSSRGGNVQSNFIACLRKQVEELLNCSQDLKDDFCNYVHSGRWPNGESHGDKRQLLLSWYVQWFGVPSPSVIKVAVEKVKPKLKSSSLVPLLHLLFPRTHINAIAEIDKLFSSKGSRWGMDGTDHLLQNVHLQTPGMVLFCASHSSKTKYCGANHIHLQGIDPIC